VCLYDFMIGRFPFADDSASNAEVFRSILKAPLRLPKWLDHEEGARPMLQGLLTREPARRLGAGPEGYEALKGHAFFAGFSWDGLLSRQLPPPFLPRGETYAEDQEAPEAALGPGSTDPRMTLAMGASCDAEAGDDSWQDPEPSWQQHF